MKIVITGALGHIGSHLIRTLPLCFPQATFMLIDNLATQRYPSLFSLPAGVDYGFQEADVTKDDLETLFAGAHAVIHLAALTDAASSFTHADEVRQNNLQGTVRVAAACAAVGARLIFSSSTSVYGSQASWVDENCPESQLRPQSPYADTKLQEERAIADLVATHDLKAAVCRFGTIFGASPGMRFHTAVNRFCWQAAMHQPLTVWETAYDQKRPYLGLIDAGRAVAFLLDRDLFDGGLYNVVSENATVHSLVECIRVHAPDLEVQFVSSPIMNQLSYEVGSVRLSQAGFAARATLKQGIAETFAILGRWRSRR